MNFLKAFVGLFLAVQLASCSTASSTSNNSSALIGQQKEELSKSYGMVYALGDTCYSKGFMDADFVARSQNAIDYGIKSAAKKFDKNLMASSRRELAQQYRALPLEDIKNICYQIKPNMARLILNYEEAQRAVEIQKNRPVIINNSQPSYTPPTYSLPKTTTCNNLGFGMTSCTTF